MKETDSKALLWLYDYAAPKIQALYRGHKGRVKAMRRKSEHEEEVKVLCVDIIARAWRVYRVKCRLKELARLRELREREAASTVIQRIMRGYLGRKLYAKLKSEKLLRIRNNAATEIQVNSR
jgi:hypothetical protein